VTLQDDVRDFPGRCRREVCQECGGLIGWRLHYDWEKPIGLRTSAVIYCLANREHQGTKPAPPDKWTARTIKARREEKWTTGGTR